MTTRAGLKSEIEYAGISEIVIDWIFKEHPKPTYKDICKRLKEQYNIELTEMSIYNYKKYVLKNTADFISENKEVRDKISRKMLDTVEVLCFAINEITEKIKEFKENKDWRQHSTYLMLYLHEANLLLKRAGEIKSAGTTFIDKQQNITYNQVNQVVQSEICRMIDEGHIPLEPCSEVVKEFYRKQKKVV